MPTLAERRAQVAAQGGPGASGEFIRFKQEGEVKILRFLFTDATTLESHRKFYNEETKEWEIDGDKGSYKVTFNCVQYQQGGANPTRCRFELSEYLYNEYLAPYVEKDVPASKNVWEIKVRRPGTMDVSYVAFKVDGATELNYPIPPLNSTTQSAPAPATPTYAQPTPVTAAPGPVATPAATTPIPPVAPQATQYAPPVQTTAPVQQPVQNTPTEAPKKSKYF